MWDTNSTIKNKNLWQKKTMNWNSLQELETVKS